MQRQLDESHRAGPLQIGKAGLLLYSEINRSEDLIVAFIFSGNI